jgi:hypothetical protein
MTRAWAAAREPRTAWVLLLAVYAALSLLNDPRGYLGTDTGGKVATLEAMERSGRLDPDVGYWAERWDPAGDLHPLYYTARLDGKWVNVTTLPALYVAFPLYRLGGYRAALLVPMLGSVLAALAAAALARRLGSQRPHHAFWIIGLASPLAIYALDFWEHSLGVALLAWAVVLLLDVRTGSRRWWAAAGAGLLVGLAATMRTEALVVGAVATAVTCVLLLWPARHVRRAVLVGLAALAGVILPLAANQALERLTIGTTLRAERAASLVGTAVQRQDESRVEEAVLTGLSPYAVLSAEAYVSGLLLLGLLLVVARLAGHQRPERARLARVAATGAGALYAIRLVRGLGFVPGLVAAAPLAAVGLAFGRRLRGGGFVLAAALLSLPLVWALQYTGGAAPQWAGRYILVNGLLLGTLGVVALGHAARWARVFFVGLAVGVTAFGLAWVSVRTHDVGRAGARLAARPEPVLISRIAHLPRETGWFVHRIRWLTAETRAKEPMAVQVVLDAGYDQFALVEGADDAGGQREPHDIGGFERVGSERIPYIADSALLVTTYRRTG